MQFFSLVVYVGLWHLGQGVLFLFGFSGGWGGSGCGSGMVLVSGCMRLVMSCWVMFSIISVTLSKMNVLSWFVMLGYVSVMYFLVRGLWNFPLTMQFLNCGDAMNCCASCLCSSLLTCRSMTLLMYDSLYGW